MDNNKVCKKIMQELVQARRDQGITQKRLAELSGVNQSIIARMETGVTKPQVDTVVKVLSILGKTLQVSDLKVEYCPHCGGVHG